MPAFPVADFLDYVVGGAFVQQHNAVGRAAARNRVRAAIAVPAVAMRAVTAGESACETKGECACETKGESACETKGESACETKGESACETTAHNLAKRFPSSEYAMQVTGRL